MDAHPIAQASDIADRWRPLTEGENAIINTLISDAQDILVDALEDRGVVNAPDSARWTRSFIRVVSNMVKRVLQNPEGYLSTAFTIDDYRQEYRRDSAVSAGALYATDTEIDGLMPFVRKSRGAFSIVLGRS